MPAIGGAAARSGGTGLDRPSRNPFSLCDLYVDGILYHIGRAEIRRLGRVHLSSGAALDRFERSRSQGCPFYGDN